MKKIIFFDVYKIIMVSLGLAIALPLIAADTGQINYQARLLDSYGRRVNDTVDLSFKIYDAVTAGNLLWSETQAGVVVQDGVYSVVLGSQTNIPASVFAQNTVYLELGINGETMSPRQQITASAYSLVARTVMGSNIFENQTSGYVGVGTTNPAVKLDVSGTVQSTGFKMPTGASANYVLVSDASGVGTWQTVSIVVTNIQEATNALNTAVGNLNTSTSALNTAVGLRVLKAGDIMTGPLTNAAFYGGFIGDGGGLTNISSSGVSLTGVVHRIGGPGNEMTGPLVISNNLTVAITNAAGTTNYISLGGVAISNWNQVSGGDLTNDLVGLQGATNALNTAVTNEIAVRDAADTGISNAYIAADTVVSNGLDVKVTAEATTRNNADVGISNAYIAADTVVSNGLDVKVAAEATARNNADVGISNAYIAADTGISNSLNAGAAMWNNAVVIKQGSGTLTISNLYYLGADGWSNANANTNTTAKGLLGLALGTDPVANGLMLNGSFTNGWGFAAGSIIYMDTNNNQLTTSMPTGTNNIVRIVGYAVTPTNIYFNPDRTYIEIMGQ